MTTTTSANASVNIKLSVTRKTSPRCAVRDLSVLAYAQGFTLWHYKAGSLPVNVPAQRGFFDDAASLLAPGDMLMVSASTGGKVLFVTGTEGGVITASMS